MTAVSQVQPSQWQEEFVSMLPKIQGCLRRAFRDLDPAGREESVAEGVAHCLLAYAHLDEQGRTHVASASTLAFYAARQVRRGRPAAGRLNGKEPLSRYAQVGNGIRVEHDAWIDRLVEDKRASVPDQVAAKLDVTDWFKTLTSRMRQIAQDLAVGFSTSEVATMHGVTAGRISQLRRSLEASWVAYQGEAVPASTR